MEQGKRVVVEVVSCDADDKADEGADKGIVFTDDAENPINNTIIYAGVEDVSEVNVEDDAYNDDHYDVDDNEIFNIHDPIVKDVGRPIIFLQRYMYACM